MAKAKTLAALAGLAGLAYAYNKNKNKDESKTDTGDETERLAKRGDRMSNEDYIKSRMKKAPEAEDANYGNEGRRTSMGVAPAPKTTTKAAPKLETYTTRKDPREAEAGMSRGTRPAVAKNPNYSNEGRNSVAPAKNPNYSNEGRSSTAPTIASKVGNIAKNTAVAAVKAANPVATAAYEFGTTPTSEQASANRQAAYDKVKSAGSKVVDYVKNFETPAERRSREAKEASGMKRGGSVNMASGGMTASRRGDGIASRGKTRGKIC
jgi:hypothetical protein